MRMTTSLSLRAAGKRYTISAGSLSSSTGGKTRSSHSSTIKMMALSILTFTGKNASEYSRWSLSYIREGIASMFTLHCSRQASWSWTILASDSKGSTCPPSTGAVCRQKSISPWSRPSLRVGPTSTLNCLSPSIWAVYWKSRRHSRRRNLNHNPKASCLKISWIKTPPKKSMFVVRWKLTNEFVTLGLDSTALLSVLHCSLEAA